MRISDWSSDVCSSDLVRAGSVIMLYCIAGDRNPRLLAVFIDRIVGHETMAGLEITERDGIGVMIGARSVPDARAAGAAEKEVGGVAAVAGRSEEHTSELQSLMRISYAVFCLKKKTYDS